MHDYMVQECITELSIEDFFWFGKTDNLQWLWNLRFVCLTVAVSNAVSTKIKTILQRRKCSLHLSKKTKKNCSFKHSHCYNKSVTFQPMHLVECYKKDSCICCQRKHCFLTTHQLSEDLLILTFAFTHSLLYYKNLSYHYSQKHKNLV